MMEGSSENGDAKNGYGSKAITEQKSRPKKSKSTVSARLDPNFDPRDMVNDDSNSINVELDPTTMTFDELVGLLHPTFISDYLHKVLQFLRGDRTETCFPNIAPYKQAFLVKICDDKKYLKCSLFNEVSTLISNQIIDIIETNNNVYKWTYQFESGRASKNVLVYKKVLNVPQYCEPLIQSTAPCTTATSAGASLTSSIENFQDARRLVLRKIPKSSCKVDNVLQNSPQSRVSDDLNTSNASASTDSEGRKRLPKLQRHTLMISNILSNLPELIVKKSLQNMLSFVTNPKRASWICCNIPVNQARFFECMATVIRNNQYYQLFHPECVPLLQQITAAVNRQKWKLTLDLGKLSKKTGLRDLTFYKVPKNKHGQYEFNTVRYVDLESPINTSSAIQRVPEREKENCAGNVNCSVDNGVSRNRPVSKDRCLSQEEKRDTRHDTSSSVDHGPPANIPASKGSRVSEREKENCASNGNSSVVNGVSRHRPVSKDRRPPERVKRNTGHEASPNSSVEHGPPRNIAKGKDPRNQSKGITFQCAGADIADDLDRPMDLIINAPKRNKKLIEAMSTPMECDRAERMMRLMGWEGGALGLRGEGITEPILPALHISPGAGLGHVQIKSTSKSEFRVRFLQSLLAFFESGETETTIHYETPMSKREARFIPSYLTPLSKWNNIELKRDREVDLTRRLEVLARKDVTVEWEISADKKHVKLRKSPSQIQHKSTKKKKKKSQQSHQTEDHQSTADMTEDAKSKKAAKTLAQKIIIMTKIKEFVQITEPEKEYRFGFVIHTKQKRYIQSVIANINNRRSNTKGQYHTDEERDLLREIRDVAGDCYVTVVFDTQKVILQKKYYQKRFTNSALDLPPPKSMDLKNTIIYKNNTVIRGVDIENNDNIVNDDSDDDVLIITETPEVFEISDDDDDIKTESVTDVTDSIADASYSNVKLDTSTDSEFERDIQDLVKVIADSDIEDIDKKNFIVKEEESFTSDECANVNSSHSVKTDLEINNNYNLVVDQNGSSDIKEEEKETDVIKAILSSRNRLTSLKVEDCVNVALADESPPSKRSRSDSVSLEKISKKYKIELAQNISITPKDSKEISADMIKKVKRLITENIDESTFLPLLTYHGVKNNGLIYSCYNGKTLVWLVDLISVASDLNLKVTDTDFREDENRRMQIKISTSDDVERIFRRLMLYNPGLDPSVWKVIDKTIYEDFLVISVIVDFESFKFISKEGFSLFCGADTARFSVIWG